MWMDCGKDNNPVWIHRAETHSHIPRAKQRQQQHRPLTWAFIVYERQVDGKQHESLQCKCKIVTTANPKQGCTFDYYAMQIQCQHNATLEAQQGKTSKHQKLFTSKKQTNKIPSRNRATGPSTSCSLAHSKHLPKLWSQVSKPFGVKVRLRHTFPLHGYFSTKSSPEATRLKLSTIYHREDHRNV